MAAFSFCGLTRMSFRLIGWAAQVAPSVGTTNTLPTSPLTLVAGPCTTFMTTPHSPYHTCKRVMPTVVAATAASAVRQFFMLQAAGMA